ncbi:hypothetical protein G7Y79_00002g007770 [Physcia stellaris]|nr:hypothetical protein G7Y79_00002g007770 [Physcia stellaris]
MSTRQSRIPEAHIRTFQWIYESPEIHFHEWLQSTSTAGIYWISGKAGSGKSTLMKFLYEEERTKDALRAWTGPNKQLVIASHFFWAAGTEKQKSQDGLLQSLLHDILRQCPSLISFVCSKKLQEMVDLGDPQPWSLKDLREVFQNVLQISSPDITASMRICLFVDGLDEYDGDKADLLSLFQSSSEATNIKICLSSRPWPIFEKALYGDGRHALKVHDLTKGDISQYILDKLTRIVSKAQGVFLWVFLVVRSLLEGLQNDDDITILEKRVAELPPDLESYFQRVLDEISPAYRKDTARLLKTMLCAREPLPLISLQAALSHVTDDNLDTNQGVYDGDWAERMNETMKKQIHARCRDFLEIKLDSSAKVQRETYGPAREARSLYRVDFLHSTVKDFLEAASVKSQLATWVEGPFNPSVCVCTCLRFWIKTMPLSSFDDPFVPERLEIEWRQIGRYFRCLEKNRDMISYDLIDDFNEDIKKCQKSLNEKDGGSKIKSYRWFLENFLWWALSHGLFFYVHQKIQLDPELVTKDNRQLLLIMAAQSKYSKFDLEPVDELRVRISLVRSIFEAGAQPEAGLGRGFYTKPPRWRLLLRYLHYLRGADRDIDHGSELEMRREALVDFTELLISYGADPEDDIPVGYYGVQSDVAFEYIERWLGPRSGPDQVNRLIAAFKKPREKGRQLTS